MKEAEFVRLLQERAKEQKRAMEQAPFPTLFVFTIEWLSDHPWRFLIPLAFLISLILRSAIGAPYTDFVLRLFRGI